MTEFRRLAIPEVVEVTPPKFGDHRGFFSEVFKRAAFEAEGLAIDWMQDNQSFSAEVGTVRGLHFQAPPFAQAKLIRVLRGAIFDVAVDLRRGSPSYGRWVAAELSAEKWNQLLVPVGFAHGFMTLTPDVEVLYKVSAPYSRESEGAIRWDDPDLGIVWPRPGDAILSEKDAVAPYFKDFDSPFAYEAD
ncbi:MAG: dTDP-4-dehydrorhamnose 3,5-epimerase [Sphingomonas sp.]|uniref:dTDP-4-dehydrorhamnose 3,5-epimerase n=1 Tax=Sphingomonas sp. TaxID=28214 RepID=UPI0022735963|nr:dTDP-4-dehydrorhamnose 3,5-epimerase [Sphingomonas sp.]MCX8474721.1 dTDP-4-dehydrorhamnose 3,5-epimerase [Sphingomonas sp.]